MNREPVFNTDNQRVKNFKNFNQNIDSEKEELRDIKKGFKKNAKEIGQQEHKFKWNKLTNKMDDVVEMEIDDKIDQLEEVEEKMSHLKGFEQYNEGTLSTIGNGILGIFMLAIGGIITQFLNPRKIVGQFESIIDIYNSADLLIEVLQEIMDKEDLTDVEKSEIDKKISNFQKAIEKYDSVEDYKKTLARTAQFANIRNRKFMKRKVMEYEPKKLSRVELENEIRKVYKGYRYKGDDSKIRKNSYEQMVADHEGLRNSN